MSDELEQLLASFAAADAGVHLEVLDQVDSHADSAPLEDVSLEEALRRFNLGERQRAVLLADGGWTSDLVVFLGHVLQKINPSLRASFPGVNAILESLAAGVPGGGIAVHALLVIAEGPLLSLLEAWLLARANAIEARRRTAQG